ncbi:MAG: serine/threonine-protein kinase [Planctomycetes bacterium]|jgi:serine/threonine protein kinase|nr:serine/threonine-protein kinase [Planctomycetota bacterium]
MDATPGLPPTEPADRTPWHRLKEIVADALELPEGDRSTFLGERCGALPELRAEAEAMLTAAAAAADFLERPVLEPAAVQPLPAGERCGPYVIEALVGEGGFSEVYRARQTTPIDRCVALKVLKPGMDSRAVLARFALERRTLARLEHPGIARILDAGATATGRPFVVVEFQHGLPLRDYVAAARPGQRQRLRLFLQVCDAVAHAHRRGVIHRDLKPSNVMVTGEGEHARAVVIDFGIAKVLDGSGDDHTHTGQFLGTPAYSSPEQRHGDPGDIDTRTDVHALGVVLDELLSGQTPAAGRPRPSPGVPRELGWIIAMATAPDRDHRYPGAAELAADVQAFLTLQPLRAGPPTLRYRLGTFARRHRLALCAAAAVLLAVLGGTTAAAIGYWRAEAARSEAELARAEATATADYLTRLLSAADPGRRGRDVKVVDLLAASKSLLTQAQERPDVAARLHQVVGRAYAALGEYAEAELHLRAAADSFVQRHGELDRRGLDATLDVASVLHRSGQLALAEPLLDQLEARARRIPGDHDTLLRHLIDMRAKLAFDRGNPAAAEAPLRELLALDSAAGRTDAVIATSGNLAQVLLGLRRIDEARALAVTGRDLAVAKHGPHHPLALAAARKLAAVHLQAADHEAMVRELTPLLAPARERLGSKHPDTLGLLLYYATALQQLERLAEAEPLFAELVALQQQQLGRLHPQVMMTLTNYGTLLVAKGDLAAAEPILRDACERLTEVRGPDDEQSRLARHHLARAIAAQGRHREIAGDYEAAVAALGRSLPAAAASMVTARRDWLRHLQALASEQSAHGELEAARTSWTKVHDLANDLADEPLQRRATQELARLQQR